MAVRYLARWKDPLTLNLVDDIAQLSALQALARYDGLHDPRRMPGFVRTITRRLRFRVLHRERSRGDLFSERNPYALPARPPNPVRLRVCARWIAREKLLPWLDEALERLPPLNSRMLREFYSGTSCRDLAVRYRLSLESVKVRLFRSRERLRATLEHRVLWSLA